MASRARGPHNPSDSDRLRARLEFSDAALLRECEVDTYRASGPGGQKRNKTSSAVRLRHEASGLIVTAVETRSQHQNKSVALERLREAIALRHRRSRPADLEQGLVHARAIAGGGNFRVGPRNPLRWQVLAEALDALAWADGSPAAAAKMLGVSTSALIKFFAAHSKAWLAANEIRLANRLGALIDR